MKVKDDMAMEQPCTSATTTTNGTEDKPTICSLKELQVSMPQDIREHLARQYHATLLKDTAKQEETATTLSSSTRCCYERMDHILRAMKTPPAATTCRVNFIQGSRSEIQTQVEEELQQRGLDPFFKVRPHPDFHDVLCVDLKQQQINNPTHYDDHLRLDRKGPQASLNDIPVFPTWTSRHEKLGWPVAHRAVIVDRLCGEAVLRGSHIFVRGIMVADRGVQPEETVAVYADVRSTTIAIPGGGTKKDKNKLKRGLFLEQYKGRMCIYLGLGVAQCGRADFFRHQKGIGIQMLLQPEARVGPMLPPISGILPSKVYFQNLPSMVVAHALAPEPGDTIIDMCCAPGGKTSHVASLVRNNATIVACDVSRRKMLSAQARFQEMGATCITPLALSTTDCVVRNSNEVIEKEAARWKSVQEVLASSSRTADGLLAVSGFYPESFDRVLLDPPCSALGLRPKLQLAQTTLKELQQVSLYQRKFVREAVLLLKPGGILTYSTCTFHADENERMVRYILDHYPNLQLLPTLPEKIKLGSPGLAGMGLDATERSYVRRFDPLLPDDTIGFFVAKFRKRSEA